MFCTNLLVIHYSRVDPSSRKYLHHQIGLQACNKSFLEVIQRASQLSWTRDPFDRVITAQAALEQDRLITKDRVILEKYEHAVW
jgi:PIN domain nuclease of toxin-antitoxin system